MSFELRAPLGHGEVLEGLWRSARDGRLPHALLFSGPEGVGKFVAARWFAAGLLCARGPGAPCLACGPCKRVRSEGHPDLFTVDAVAAGQDRITIAFVTPRERRSSTDYDGPAITDFLSLQPMEGGWRVVLVREAERMLEQAQNAFLKTLEEPGRATCLVLETSRPAALLATLRSRVVQVPFQPLAREDAEEVLREHVAGLEPARAAELARWSHGAPGRALTLEARGALEMRALLFEVLVGDARAAQAAAVLWDLAGDFPGKTPAAQRRLRAQTFLDVGLEVLADVERAAAGVDASRLAHGDRLGRLPDEAPSVRRARLEAWLLARQDVALNVSPEALVDRALRAAEPRTAPLRPGVRTP